MGKFVNLIFLSFTLIFLGCAGVEMPKYVTDQYPYKKTVYADFDQALKVTSKTLQEFGWTILETADPKIYELNKEIDDNATRQILLFSQMRQAAFLFGTRYYQINVYLRTISTGVTEVEVRYVSATSIFSKSFYDYRKDKYVERILKEIEDQLKTN